MHIFISYSRENRGQAETLAGEIQELGHVVWLDEELTGGQAWWGQILATIRNCEVFLFVLSPRAMDSAACKREYTYAYQLRKRILPVLIEDISMNLIPLELSKIQYVDYRSQDKRALLALNKALQNLPPPQPIPDLLPDEPEVPISYLSNIKDQMDQLPLDFASQIAIVLKLKDHMNNAEEFEDARGLLEELRGHEGLLSRVANEIDSVLLNSPAILPKREQVHSTETKKQSVPTPTNTEQTPVDSIRQATNFQPKKAKSTSKVGIGMVLLGLLVIILIAGVAGIAGILISSSNRPSSPPANISQPIIAPQPTNTSLPTNAPQPTPVELIETFLGVDGSALLEWEIAGILYAAFIETSGLTGYVDVTYYDPSFGTNVVVRQVLSLQDYQGTWVYVGSNPHYADTEISASNYAPDAFRLAPLISGEWTIDAVCDANLNCASVTITPLR